MKDKNKIYCCYYRDSGNESDKYSLFIKTEGFINQDKLYLLDGTDLIRQSIDEISDTLKENTNYEITLIEDGEWEDVFFHFCWTVEKIEEITE